MTKRPAPILLGINIDHVATLRQVRLGRYPDPIQAAIEAEQAGEEPERRPDDERRKDDPNGGEDPDRPFAVEQIAQVDVQRSGEEQEAQHPFHQELAEVDLLEDAVGPGRAQRPVGGGRGDAHG